jgi:hypothetical protein
MPHVDARKIDRVNATIDGPSKFIPGMAHRRLYHSPRDQMLLAIMEQDAEVFMIGQIHALLDRDRRLQKLFEFL